MFMKRKTRAKKTYAYRMRMSFETSVTYKNLLTSRRTAVSVRKQLSPDVTELCQNTSTSEFPLICTFNMMLGFPQLHFR